MGTTGESSAREPVEVLPEVELTCQAAIVRMPEWTYDGAGRPVPRSRAAVCIASSGEECWADLDNPVRTPGDALTRALDDLAHEIGSMPGVVAVATPEAEAGLRAKVEAAGSKLVVSATLDWIKDIIEEQEVEAFSGDAELTEPLIEQAGMTAERVRAFADAASLFAQAEPWTWGQEKVWMRVNCEGDPQAVVRCRILADPDGALGLAVSVVGKDAPSPHDCYGDQHADLLWMVAYGILEDVPLQDGDLWVDHGLPVADADHYPFVAGICTCGRLMRPGPDHLTHIEMALRALVSARTDEPPKDGWTGVVPTFSGERSVSMHIGVADNPTAMADANASIRDLEEALGPSLGRALSEDDDDSAADIADGSFVGPGLALELVARAMEISDRTLQILYCRRALQADPNSVEALMMLARLESTSDDERLARMQEAVAAGERLLGPELFENNIGRFWQDLDARSYLRARRCVADIHFRRGEFADAAAVWRRSLELDAGDHESGRFNLLGCLLAIPDLREAEALIARYSDEPGPWWDWAKVFIAVSQRDQPGAEAALAAARKSNYRAEKYLNGTADLPRNIPGEFEPGSDQEAWNLALDLLPAWEGSMSATAWLRSKAPRSGPPKFKERKKKR